MLHKRDSIWRRLWKFRTDTCPIPCKCFHCFEIFRDVIDPRFLIISELLSLQCNSWKLETYIWTEIGNLTGHLTKVLKLISYIHLILPTAKSSIFLWVQYWVDKEVDSYCDILCVFSEVFLSHNFTYTILLGAGAWVWPWSLRCSNNPFQPGQCIWPPWQHPETERTLGEGLGH